MVTEADAGKTTDGLLKAALWTVRSTAMAGLRITTRRRRSSARPSPPARPRKNPAPAQQSLDPRPAARGRLRRRQGYHRFGSGARLPICPRDVYPPQNKGCRPTPPWLTAPAAVFPVPRCAWTSRRWQPSQAVKPQLRRCGSDGSSGEDRLGPDVCGHDPHAGHDPDAGAGPDPRDGR